MSPEERDTILRSPAFRAIKQENDDLGRQHAAVYGRDPVEQERLRWMLNEARVRLLKIVGDDRGAKVLQASVDEHNGRRGADAVPKPEAPVKPKHSITPAQARRYADAIRATAQTSTANENKEQPRPWAEVFAEFR